VSHEAVTIGQLGVHNFFEKIQSFVIFCKSEATRMRNYEDERTLAMGNSSRPSEELLRHENLFLPQLKGKRLNLACGAGRNALV